MRKALHLVTSGKQPLAEVLSILRQVENQGVDFLHLREKHLPASELVHWIESISDYFPRQQVLVNDRVDVAVACGCAGAHLAYHSLPPVLAKQVLHAEQLVGKSTHSLHEAEEAYRQGADYLFFGHIYESGSKPDIAPRGSKALAEVVSSVDVPVIAIGGIQPQHIPELLVAGCAGIAVLSGITSATDSGKAVKAYREALDREEGLQ